MERKMHCALEDISTESPEVLTPGKDSLRNQEQQLISTTPLKDCEESAFSGRNSDSSPPILAYLTFQPDGNWKIVALPVWCLGHTNLATGVIMDGLQLVLPSPLNRSKIGQHKGLRTNVPDYAYSLKPFMGRSNAGSNVYRRCQNKIANRAAKLNETSGNSCSDRLISGNPSDVFADDSAVVNSSNTLMSTSKADKPVKKNPRKKAKKKGRQGKKQSSDSSSTEPEVLSEACGCASLAPEVCDNNDADDQNMLISYTNGSEFSSSNCTLIQNDSERHVTGNRINLVESAKTSTSSTDEVEMAEATPYAVQKSTGESSLCNSKNQLQSNVSESAVTEGKTNDMQRNHSALYPEGFPGTQDSMLDAVFVASNSNGNTNAGVVEKQTNKASCQTSCSEPPVSKSEDGYLSSQGLLDAVGNDLDHNEGNRYGAPNCSIGDKRVKQKRTSQSCASRIGAGNFICRTGKENSHSVWQKVQKNNANECNGDSKKVNASLPQCNSSLKKAPPVVSRNSTSDCANSLSKTDNKRHSKSKVNRKSKGKIDSDLKKGYCNYSRKGSRLSRSSFNDSAEVSVQLNDMPQVSSQENSQEESSSVSESHSHFDSPKGEIETKGNQHITSEPVDNAQIHVEDCDLPKDVSHNISTMKNLNTNLQNSSLSIPSDDIDQSSVSEEQSSIHSHLSGHEVGQAEKEASSAAYNVQNNSSGSTLWKWIPIGKKDSRLAISGSDSSTPEYSYEPPHGDSTLETGAKQKEVCFSEKVSSLNENNAESNEVSFSEKQVSLSNDSRTCMNQISSCFSGLDEDENKELRNQVTANLSVDKDVVDNRLTSECKYHVASENYSFRIAQAINDACRVQLACEAVHMVTGGPVAEVERLLHKCSPSICQSSHSLGCLFCSQDNANSATPCGHVTPDLTLGGMWQWYEKHGSYGLEIRAQDCTSRRLGGSRVPFRAYFVPSLSAVQLFKDHKVQCSPRPDKFSDCNISEACEIRDMSGHSAASRHPNLSGCFPQPWNQDADISVSQSQMPCSELPSSATDNGFDISVDSSYCGDLELLFEYFESEQPQQRQPLYEKIEELVRGSVSSQSRVYGDPTILDSVNLQDLHPRSWFSVAWYPIYRIPCGNFRASFLTYHSLGHLVHRSIKSDSPTLDSCIVSPVVGLQSYNAQGECWFKLSQSAQAAQMLGLNPSFLLKERLRTLEETASLMSRSIVNKDNSACKSIHPDYEFFLSRRR